MSASERLSPPYRLSSRLNLALLAAAVLPPTIGSVVSALFSPDAFEAAVRGLAVALISAVIVAGALSQTVGSRLNSDVRMLTRIARRLASGEGDAVVVHGVSEDFSPLARELEGIGAHLETLETEFDRLEINSDLERDRRLSELEVWRGESVRLKAEAEVLYSFASAISRTVDPAQICAKLIEHAGSRIEYSLAAAFLVSAGSGELLPVYLLDQQRRVKRVGNYLKDLAQDDEVMDEGERQAIAWVTQTRHVLVVAEGRNERFRSALRSGLRSLLVVPMLVNDQVKGIVVFGNPRANSYDEQAEKLITTLADRAALSIEFSRLLEEAAKVEALRELDRFKSDLLATVSHELKTPLVSIKGFTETLLRSDVEWSVEERREWLNYIFEEGERLETLIQDLLQMSEIEAGMLSIRRKAVSIPRLAQSTTRRIRARARDHTLSTSFPGELPLVYADPARVEQVLSNLIQNAIKYTPPGGNIRLRGAPARELANGRYELPSANPTHIAVAVADDGVGITPEHATMIFERFYRVDDKLTREIGGSGLGLAISRGIVEAHGGRIWVESPGATFRVGADGQGSTFIFTLPLHDPTKHGADTDDDQLDLMARDSG